MYEFVNGVVRVLKKIVPEPVVRLFRPPYHYLLGWFMALSYGFPMRRLTVIGVTGTKGKSTTAEMLFAILRQAGKRTALLSTIRFAVEDDSEPNLYKMTLPGRGFSQSLARRALEAGCTHLVIEVTSESVLQHRHLFFYLDGLIVTNIQREHIESHGSFDNYVGAKRDIALTLLHSPKPECVLVANADVPETNAFLALPFPKAIGFREAELEQFSGDDRSVSFRYGGTPVTLPVPGKFNALNALAALKMAEALGIPPATSAAALAVLAPVKGRAERIEEGQDFVAVVDYAHTPDSLRALYSAFADKRKICVLGNTGGGRDAWKRPVMGSIAEEMCEKVILTNEDPYDENPETILSEMAIDMKRPPEIILDRREAIRRALALAQKGDAVLISGKGTDPYIMGPRGSKTPWSDAEVVREELRKIVGRRQEQ